MVAIAFLLLAALFANCECYKIMLLFPIASRSHHNLGFALAKGLTDAGHEVTLISPYDDEYESKNGTFTPLMLDGVAEKMEESKKTMNMFEVLKGGTISKLFRLTRMFSSSTKINEYVLEHKKIADLIKSKVTFHAVIFEQSFAEAIKGLAPQFNAHQILLNPTGIRSIVSHYVGDIYLSSTDPSMMLGYPPKMNFWQRLVNTLVDLVSFTAIRRLMPEQKQTAEKYFPDGLDLDKVIRNVSLILQNNHPVLKYPSTSVPNIIDIAGYHLKSPKPLVKELQEYLDNSPNGVIYFSMGSVCKSKDMPIEFREKIVAALGRFKQRILWKFEDEELPNLPENIMIKKWLPQESILAHPKVKVFITHGGLLSTIETVHYGVPIVAIPIFGDQLANAKLAEYNGYGKIIPFVNLETEELFNVINEVLTNTSYHDNVKDRSKQFRDRLRPPLETAIYWIEYVIRHNGAHHLRVASADLAWYQLYLVDVAAFLIGVSIILSYLCYIFIKITFRKLFLKKNVKKSKLL